MARITLYYHDTPVTHHPLAKRSFSVGSHPTNDLVLAGDGVAERQLVIFRDADGRWRARPTGDERDADATDLARPGARIALGQFSLELDPDCRRPGTPPDDPDEPFLVGCSTQLSLLRRDITRLGPIGAPVLVTGETGTGKELVARGLHAASGRRGAPFVALNCGGLTPSMMEDTLFGHDRGSFTGAVATRKGVFEQAEGGTLFLDEIGEMPLPQQAALLRVLDDGRVSRIGSEIAGTVDFRLVAATNRDLPQLIDEGRFRLDFYHRIAALSVTTAPLRDRPEDIAPLARHFLSQMAPEMGPRSLTEEALAALRGHRWSGNARELRNILLRAVVTTEREQLDAGDLELHDAGPRLRRQPFRLDAVPRAKLEALLADHRGNVAAAARELGVPRTSLRDRLRRKVDFPLTA